MLPYDLYPYSALCVLAILAISCTFFPSMPLTLLSTLDIGHFPEEIFATPRTAVGTLKLSQQIKGGNSESVHKIDWLPLDPSWSR